MTRHAGQRDEDGLLGIGDLLRKLGSLVSLVGRLFRRLRFTRSAFPAFSAFLRLQIDTWLRNRKANIKRSWKSLNQSHNAFQGIRRTLSVALVLWLVWACTASIVEFFDPFGLSANANRNALSIAERIRAPFYESGSRRPAVILITDRTLEAEQHPWPLPYNFYLDLFRRLARAQPSSIFLDIVIQDGRDTRENRDRIKKEFNKLFAELDFPVFAAQFGDEDRNFLSGRKKIELVPVRWKLPQYLYPLYINRAETAPSFEFAEPRATPALLQYKADCNRDGLRCNERLFKDPDQPPILVEWGQNVSSKWLEIANISSEDSDHCRSLVDPTTIKRMWNAAVMLLGYAWGKSALYGNDSLREPCPYIPFFTARRDLFNGGPDDKTLTYLRGRPLLIGAGLTGSGDLAVSPVHGLVPGVFAHAMALDNLLTYHSQYGTYAEHPWARRALWATAAYLMAVVLVGCQRAALPRRYFFASACAVVTFFLLIGQAIFGGVLLDWTYILTLCGALFFFRSRHSVREVPISEKRRNHE